MSEITLMDIYYPIAFFVSWIGILIWLEVNKDSAGFEFLEDDEELPMKLLTHVLAFFGSFIIPFVWPFAVFYLIIMFFVRRIARLIRIHIKKENTSRW